MGRYEQCDGSVEARVLRHESGRLLLEGPRGLGAQGFDAGSTTGGDEGGAKSTRVTENHVETTDSSDRGRERLTSNKGNVDSIK